MKIDARVNLRFKPQNMLFENVRVAVDADYVEADEADIREWILNSNEMYDISKQHSLPPADCTVEILNLDELLEELTFDEFAAATNLDNPKWE